MNFKAPSGADPVMVNLEGMGKGKHGWTDVALGGIAWPSFLVDKDGCNNTCDYRGAYIQSRQMPDKLRQSYSNFKDGTYHIPRSYLGKQIKHIDVVWRDRRRPLIHRCPSKQSRLELHAGAHMKGKRWSCHVRGGSRTDRQSQKSSLLLASIGDPQGTCGSFKKGSCESANSLYIYRAKGNQSKILTVIKYLLIVEIKWNNF